MRRLLPLTVSGGRGGLIKAPWSGPRAKPKGRFQRVREGGSPSDRTLCPLYAFMALFAPLLGGLLGGCTDGLLDLSVLSGSSLGPLWDFKGVPYV